MRSVLAIATVVGSLGSARVAAAEHDLRLLTSARESAQAGGVLARGRTEIRIEVPRATEIATSAVDPIVAKRVREAVHPPVGRSLHLSFAPVELSITDGSVTELDIPWDIEPTAESKPFRPDIFLDYVSFPTGGGGLKLVVRENVDELVRKNILRQ